MGHKCNAWCFNGLHAVLYDYEASEFAHMADAAKILANQAGLVFDSFSVVQPPNAAPVGTPTRYGVARGRVVIWGKDFGV